MVEFLTLQLALANIFLNDAKILGNKITLDDFHLEIFKFFISFKLKEKSRIIKSSFRVWALSYKNQ